MNITRYLELMLHLLNTNTTMARTTRAKNIRIYSIDFLGNGHHKVIVEQTHYGRKFPYGITSFTYWERITTNTMAICDYQSSMPMRYRRGFEALVREAKMFGNKSVKKF